MTTVPFGDYLPDILGISEEQRRRQGGCYAYYDEHACKCTPPSGSDKVLALMAYWHGLYVVTECAACRGFYFLRVNTCEPVMFSEID